MEPGCFLPVWLLSFHSLLFIGDNSCHFGHIFFFLLPLEVWVGPRNSFLARPLWFNSSPLIPDPWLLTLTLRMLLSLGSSFRFPEPSHCGNLFLDLANCVSYCLGSRIYWVVRFPPKISGKQEMLVGDHSLYHFVLVWDWVILYSPSWSQIWDLLPCIP